MVVDKKSVGYIYTITNKINGKIYVGQTRQEPRKRWWQHQETARDPKMLHIVLYKAMTKYGVGNFCFATIETVITGSDDELTDLLNERESYWIAHYDAHGAHGYNMTDGGSDSPKVRSRPVVELNHEGFVVGIFESARIAAESKGVCMGNIHHGCRSKSHYCSTTDSFWYYSEDICDSTAKIGDNFGEQHRGEKFLFQNGNSYGSKQIAEYSIDGNLVNIYPSIENAGLYSGVSEASIRRCLNGEYETVKGKKFALYQ